MSALAHLREIVATAHWSFFVLLGVGLGLGLCRGHLAGSQRAAADAGHPEALSRTALHDQAPSTSSRRHHDEPR